MLTPQQALSMAQAALPGASRSGLRESREGWYFPGGGRGVIVNKRSGATCRLDSALPVERALSLYDKGYQFSRYDLVVTSVKSLACAIEVLARLGLQVVEPSFEHGAVRRIPRDLTSEEIRTRLTRLPCVFGDVQLSLRAELLEDARMRGDLQFELFEFRTPPA